MTGEKKLQNWTGKALDEKRSWFIRIVSELHHDCCSDCFIFILWDVFLALIITVTHHCSRYLSCTVCARTTNTLKDAGTSAALSSASLSLSLCQATHATLLRYHWFWPLLLSGPARFILLPYFWLNFSSFGNHLLLLRMNPHMENWCYHSETMKMALDCNLYEEF